MKKDYEVSVVFARGYLNKKIAAAINGVLDDFEGLPIIYMEILCIFNL